MVTLLLFIAFVGFLLYVLTRPDSRTKKLGDEIQGPAPRPIIGNAYDFPLSGPNSEKVHEKTFKMYRNGFRIWAGPKLVYVCGNSDDAEVLLKSATEIRKGFVYKYLLNWLGDGLLLSTGEKWHLRRKAMTPSFHFQILEEFVEVFEKNSETLVSCLKERANEGEFDLTSYINAYTLDVITETSMKTKVNAQRDPNNTYVKAIREIAQILSHRFNSPWLYSDFLYKLSGQYNCNGILENVKVADLVDSEVSNVDELGRRKRTALLPTLLKLKQENNPAFTTDEDIREEVETFIFEGHDTTSAGIKFALGCLARHPEIQEKAYEEVKEVLNDVDRVTVHTFNQLKYLERVIKESLRLYPSVPIIARQLNEDLILPSSGLTVPRNAMFSIHLYFLHRNPDYFTDPTVFNPDNFLPENVDKRPIYSYLPFSSGLRNCIGQKFALLEIKSALAKLLLNYKFSCEPGTPKEIPVYFEITLQALNGHKIRVSKR